MMTQQSAAYFNGLQDELVRLIQALCRIPAPSGREEKRAAFCADWLRAHGARGVYIDSANNVLFPWNCSGREKIILFCAHTDTVFPDTEPMPFLNDGEYLRSPGVGDDTAAVAMLLTVAGYVAQKGICSDYGILFAANAGEEGLGNLRGIRQIMDDYGDKIVEVYAFDATYDHVFNHCVGSERYRVLLRTEGGHSFYDFGNRNAIAAASALITQLYQQEVPQLGNGKTTYNVGVIEGGCSVNTVAQEAEFLYEYRSDDHACLCTMRQKFRQVLEDFRAKNLAEISVETVGIRPCANLHNTARLQEMTQRAIAITEKYTGGKCEAASASTDCNVPMSRGIPAVCMGCYMGRGAHTREEMIRIDSLCTGLKIVAETVLDFVDCGAG